MKGRDSFTAGEAQEIRRLLREKEEASHDEQKRIRRRIRRIGFYLSNWGASTLEDFDRLISQGQVRIAGGSLPSSGAQGGSSQPTSGPDDDERYIVDLCDVLLGQKASRQHRFQFLTGDSGVPLPVDAYYPLLRLVVEYRERQHTEDVPFFDRHPTVSGVPRGEQRALYDQRRREVLPKHGIALVELSYSDFAHDNRKRLLRGLTDDAEIIRKRLRDWLNPPQQQCRPTSPTCPCATAGACHVGGRRTIRDIRDAVATGQLPEPFGASEVNRCLQITYAGTFLPKHRVGNPGGYTELFIRVSERPSRYRLR